MCRGGIGQFHQVLHHQKHSMLSLLPSERGKDTQLPSIKTIKIPAETCSGQLVFISSRCGLYSTYQIKSNSYPENPQNQFLTNRTNHYNLSSLFPIKCALPTDTTTVTLSPTRLHRTPFRISTVSVLWHSPYTLGVQNPPLGSTTHP